MHHIHFHIHALIHYIRHARMIGSYVRFLGMMLFALLLGLFQVDGFGETSVASALENESRCFAVVTVRHDAGASAVSDLFTHTGSTYALHQNSYTGVFHRLKPRIVMIPRMNRTPKPKSVYRCFTRAPGA